MLLLLLIAVSLFVWAMMLLILWYRSFHPWRGDLHLHPYILSATNMPISINHSLKGLAAGDTLQLQLKPEEAEREPISRLLAIYLRCNPAILISFSRQGAGPPWRL